MSHVTFSFVRNKGTERADVLQVSLLVVMAVFQNLGDLFRGGGFENQFGLASVLSQPVAIEDLQILLVLRDARGCEDRAKIGNVLV